MLNNQQSAVSEECYMDATIVMQEALSPLHFNETRKSKGQIQWDSPVHYETVQCKVVQFARENESELPLSSINRINENRGTTTREFGLVQPFSLITLTKNNANTAEADIKG